MLLLWPHDYCSQQSQDKCHDYISSSNRWKVKLWEPSNFIEERMLLILRSFSSIYSFTCLKSHHILICFICESWCIFIFLGVFYCLYFFFSMGKPYIPSALYPEYLLLSIASFILLEAHWYLFESDHCFLDLVHSCNPGISCH